jgi:hypothetical protein
MTRPCTCDRCETTPGAAYDGSQCRACWLYHHDRAYRALWQSAGRPPDPETARRDAPCRERGIVLRQQECATCGGRVRLKVFACVPHGECTVGKAIPDLACCATCPDYVSEATAESSSTGDSSPAIV